MPLRPKPYLAKCSPERAAVDAEVTEFFVALCKRLGVTAELLQTFWHCSLKLAQNKLDGTSPLSGVDIKMLPPRMRFEVNHYLNSDSPSLRAHG